MAGLIADHYAPVLAATRQGLRLADLAGWVFGAETLESISGQIRRVSRGRVPAWTQEMPTAASFRLKKENNGDADAPAVVYLPSCVSRTMGPARADPEQEALPSKTASLLRKAGWHVVYPKDVSNLCCGQPFESKGLAETADAKAREVGEALREASGDGLLPIVSDTSPCSFRLKQALPERLRPLDIVEFIHDELMDRLRIAKGREPWRCTSPAAAARWGWRASCGQSPKPAPRRRCCRPPSCAAAGPATRGSLRQSSMRTLSAP
jgi:D-lactate dehydrogenase